VERYRHYDDAFRKAAVERLKNCPNVGELAKELGVHRRLLYNWRDQLQPVEDGSGVPQTAQESDLRRHIARLEHLLAEKTLEVDFFKGALQKVEARRQSNNEPGETPSTTGSGS
jgi:transposase-like protein